MISYGEIFLIVAAAAALFGPKDIPVIARSAGRFVGKAVGYMQSARGQLDDVMKRSQVDQVHKELHETIQQLEAIRHEIRSGISITNPGPLTRQIFNVDLKPASPAAPSTQTEAANLQSNDVKFSEKPAGPISETQELYRASSHRTMPNFRTSEYEALPITQTTMVGGSTTLVKPTGFQPGQDGTFDTIPSSTARIAAQRMVVKPVGVQPALSPQPTADSRESVTDITVLPISAVSAGLIPPRRGPLSGGADLVLESVTERKVAFDTMQFFKQSDPTVR